MIDWLKRDPRQAPLVDLGDRSLPIVVRRLARARQMTLRVAPDAEEVRVSIPRWGSTSEALAFVRSRREWIERQLAAHPPAKSPEPGGALPYRGRSLVVAHDPTGPRKPSLEGDRLQVGGPIASLGPRLRRWLEAEARALLAGDLAAYCARTDRPTPPLALSNARRRWGSCARDGAIRIQWRLVMAPDYVRQSVVAHEVAHLVHFDHGPRFHALLREIYGGDVARADQWLRANGRSLYAMFA